MAKLTYGTTCPCGARVEGQAKTPTWHTPTVTKLHCVKCGSKFLLHTKRDHESTDGRRIIADFDIIEITPQACAVQQAKISSPIRKVKDALGVTPEEPKHVEVDLDKAADE